MVSTDELCLCESNFMKSLITAAYHQCNIFINATYSSSTSSPSQSPSMTITIYHQHHYPDSHESSWGQHGAHLGPVGPRWAPHWPHEPCYQGIITITVMVFVVTLSILHSRLCVLSFWVCADSVQTYYPTFPAEAVWQPDQLYLDDARACLALQTVTAADGIHK